MDTAMLWNHSFVWDGINFHDRTDLVQNTDEMYDIDTSKYEFLQSWYNIWLSVMYIQNNRFLSILQKN